MDNSTSPAATDHRDKLGTNVSRFRIYFSWIRFRILGRCQVGLFVYSIRRDENNLRGSQILGNMKAEFRMTLWPKRKSLNWGHEGDRLGEDGLCQIKKGR
jgi:hypothetical protein